MNARHILPGKMWNCRGVLAGMLALGWIWIGVTMGGGGGAQPSATPLVDGQKVEVREGDAWSAATIVKHEGRRYFIHYEGAAATSDEWVTADRIRLAGTAGSTTKPVPAPAKIATPKPADWKVNQKVEVKWGGLWRGATVMSRRGDWYSVTYESRTFKEWVEPWRIRAVGSTEDSIGYAKPNPLVRANDGPPTPTPGLVPEPMGAARGLNSGNPANIVPPKPPGVPAAAEVAITPADRSGAIGANFDADGAPHLAPDATAAPAKALAAVAIALGSRSDFVNGVFFSSPQSALAVVLNGPMPRRVAGATHAQRVDLSSRQALAITELPQPVDGLDLSLDGKLLLGRSAADDNHTRLDVWDITATPQAKQVISFVPYDTPGVSDIKWARFVDTDHLLTQNTVGIIALWEFRKAKLIWSGGAHPDVTPALSANRRYLALGGASVEIVIVDSLTGKGAGKLAVGSGINNMHLSFKPDGKQLAAAGGDLLMIWDLASGTLTHQLTPAGATGNDLDWVDEGFVLLDRALLVSLEKKLVVWSYQTPGVTGAGASGGKYWYVANAAGAKRMLVATALPDASARQATVSVKPEAELVLRPGMQVSLEVNLAGDGRQRVFDALKKRLKENGVTVGEGKPLKLVAYSENGPERQMEYRSIGIGAAGTSRMSVHDTRNIVAVQLDGKAIWDRTYVTPPPTMLSHKQGQSIEQAIAEQMKPNEQFFESVNIPAYLQRSRTGLGASRLTATGAQAAPSGK